MNSKGTALLPKDVRDARLRGRTKGWLQKLGYPVLERDGTLTFLPMREGIQKKYRIARFCDVPGHNNGWFVPTHSVISGSTEPLDFADAGTRVLVWHAFRNAFN